jgi:hypothetical protein
MTDADFDGFVDRLVVLAEMFRAELSASLQVLYFKALRDLPAEAVNRALEECARSCTFMPRPAEVRSRIEGDPAAAIESAWLEFKRVARQVGGYASPTFADAALADTLTAIFGSWSNACWIDLTPEMWAAKRKEFDRVYRVMSDRGIAEPRQLPGQFDRDNALRGYLPVGSARADLEPLEGLTRRAVELLANAESDPDDIEERAAPTRVRTRQRPVGITSVTIDGPEANVA